MGDSLMNIQVADTIIYFKQHLSELIATGLLTPAAYDLIKTTIQYCWRKLSSHLRQNQSLSNTFCEINFKVSENTNINFQLNSNIDDSNIINNAVDKMFEYLKEKKLKERDSLLNRTEIKNTNDNIDLELNIQTQKWEYRFRPNSLSLFTE